MIAIDWSHIKELTTYDGRKIKVESRKALLRRMTESNVGLQSSKAIQVVLEQGCPLSICYDLLKVGASVSLIDNKATENYRKANGIEKTDENDAKIIYALANDGAHLQPIDVTDKMIQLHDVYGQYCRYQKARVSLQNMKKAHQRHYGGSGESKGFLKSTSRIHPEPDDNGDEESKDFLQSTHIVQSSPEEEESGARESRRNFQSRMSINLVPDLLPYDIAIETLHAREKTLLKRLETIAKGVPLLEVGGESILSIQSMRLFQPPAIKGLGQRLWLGIIVTANPTNFPCLSAYLRFCGLTSDVMATHKYNRHAKMLYHLLAEETMKQRDLKFRPLYDKIKAELVVKFPDYTKMHIHNATLNRVATFLAKDIYRGCVG